MLLSGTNLIEKIQKRQEAEVTALRAKGVTPRLVIIRDNADPVIAKYVTMKQQYGAKIGVIVDDTLVPTDQIDTAIAKNNADPSVHAIIVQLPILKPEQTDLLVDRIAPAKDVDGLGVSSDYISATASAIDNLLAAYDINLNNRKIAVVGYGKLVGRPLVKLWRDRDLQVEVFRRSDGRNLSEHLYQYSLIVSAVGMPFLISSTMVSPGTVVIDAGTASESGSIYGDATDDLRDRPDIAITPLVGGLGPLTVATLFEHTIQATEHANK